LNDAQKFKPFIVGMQYLVVWIPKYRKKALFDQLRKYLGSTFKDHAAQKESQILEGHLRPDHVHILISIPPKS
jgi:putative transposase